jgi:large subunit ribosomal protein L27
MAHKKGGGTSRNGRDSNAQARGVKCYAGESVTAGSIIIRQCGRRFKPGFNAGLGRDYTIFARVPGIVRFEGDRRVSVYPKPEQG